MLGIKIARQWPEVQEAFQRCVDVERFRSGNLWACPPQFNRPGIIYLVTQPYQHHGDMAYLHKAFRALTKWADHENVESVALPKFDVDLGELSWKFKIKPLMQEYFSPSSCKFVVYETTKNKDEARKSMEG